MIAPLSPLVALAGGLLIGLSAALLLLFSGRIAGVSGIAASATGLARGAMPWAQAVTFLAGLSLGSAIVAIWIRSPSVTVTSSLFLLIVAGLLVGFGTRLGSGCTSGHGVCGMARLSPRSLAATATFMAVAAATVFVVRHMLNVTL